MAAGGLCPVHPADLNVCLPGSRRPGGVLERRVRIGMDRKVFHTCVWILAVQRWGHVRKDYVLLLAVGRETRATGAHALAGSHSVCAPVPAVQRPAPPPPARSVPLGRRLRGAHDGVLLHQRLPSLRLPHAGLQESGELPPGEGRLPHVLCDHDRPLHRGLLVCWARSDPLTSGHALPFFFFFS